MRKKGNKQERLKRWYDKYASGVYKKNCSVCGTEFYALFDNETVCDQKKCKAKWEAMKQEAEQKVMPQE